MTARAPLLPCRHCQAAVTMDYDPTAARCWMVQCTSCKSMVRASTIDRAVDRWNALQLGLDRAYLRLWQRAF
jgi:hypothetical protein